MLAKTNSELGTKLTKFDKRELLNKMDKLPQYEDFKDLYKKTIPQIQKFEREIYSMDVEC